MKKFAVATVAIFAIPAYCFADVHQDGVPECLFEASDQQSLLDCVVQVSNRCNRAGTHVLDYAPQIACFSEISDAVLRLQGELSSEILGQNDARVHEFQVAGLAKDLGVGDLECKYQDTIARIGDPELNDESRSRSLESCRAIFYLHAYWNHVLGQRR